MEHIDKDKAILQAMSESGLDKSRRWNPQDSRGLILWNAKENTNKKGIDPTRVNCLNING